MSKNVIGLMSGTSLDGIDGALIKINEDKGKNLNIDLLDFKTIPFSETLRREILKASREDNSSVDQICYLNMKLGYKFVEAVEHLLDTTPVLLDGVDLIGSHGQTVYHLVQNTDIKATLQIGSGAAIAEKTGITTVCNFRMRDVAAGGEGAPLVPYVDFKLFRSTKYNRVLQNIGGIGNFTYIPQKASINEIKGSDTGPGNMMIDKAIKILSNGRYNYDHDGQWAEEGDISSKLMDYLLKHPFFARDFPKSTGREEFGEEYVQNVLKKSKKLNLGKKDIVATLTAFTAYSIINTYQQYLIDNIDQIIVGGGGSYNPELMKMIEKYSGEMLKNKPEVLTQDELGFSGDAKEAISFAVLAYETMKGRENNIPSATGAKKRVVLGDIIPGKDFYKYLNW
ncbi:MAG: anhydro-N-acetylmuramic acid kinase AnmK [Halanaerobiales bacterium]